MKKKMLKTLESTRFAGSSVVAVAAKPGGPEVGLHEYYLDITINDYFFIRAFFFFFQML